ncbi:hypothetical protein [Rhizobium sp. P44RR-XXIV]|uniref:hypothetical protein n=1 Tax=Rhizobium sp. P44RR-XXIV TaxID=1921145 RepID=UPI000985B941|nr:hypothetical protein [Rhizobium sp. P44RR-XXIV]TIX89038.1 hypothetical protein BSK43_020640 [Rhizobium sp. P44RR-XXIV]
MRDLIGAAKYLRMCCKASLVVALIGLPSLTQAADTKPAAAGNSASSFTYRRADLGSGYSTSSILKLPNNSSYFVTCNCDDRTLQDLSCPTQAYACTCVPHAYLMCQ